MPQRIAVITPILRTTRLLLRGVRPADGAAIAVGSGDPQVARFLTDVPTPYPVALATNWAMRRMERGALGQGPTLSVATLAQPEQTIGTVSLRIHRRDGRAELGYWLRVASWGRGYATEATIALISWGFEMGLSKIYSRVMADNVSSIRVLEKIGMKPEGLLRKHVRRGTELIDVCEFSLLSDEWSP
jgi:[ribosomal protein S5]-alanine N-acetyltransferase